MALHPEERTTITVAQPSSTRSDSESTPAPRLRRRIAASTILGCLALSLLLVPVPPANAHSAHCDTASVCYWTDADYLGCFRREEGSDPDLRNDPHCSGGDFNDVISSAYNRESSHVSLCMDINYFNHLQLFEPNTKDAQVNGNDETSSILYASFADRCDTL